MGVVIVWTAVQASEVSYCRELEEEQKLTVLRVLNLQAVLDPRRLVSLHDYLAHAELFNECFDGFARCHLGSEEEVEGPAFGIRGDVLEGEARDMRRVDETERGCMQVAA